MLDDAARIGEPHITLCPRLKHLECNQSHLLGEFLSRSLQHGVREIITLLGTLHHHRSKRSEIRPGTQIRPLNNLTDRVHFPEPGNLVKQHRRNIPVPRPESSAQCLLSDPEARPLVANRGTPSSSAIHRAVRRTASNVRPSTCNQQDPLAPSKRCIERDLLIATEQKVATHDVTDLSLRPPTNGINRKSGQPNTGSRDVRET